MELTRISHTAMEILALALAVARAHGLADGETLDSLKRSLRATDEAGSWWAFAPGSGRWHRSEKGAWKQAEEGPGPLDIESHLLMRMEGLTRTVLQWAKDTGAAVAAQVPEERQPPVASSEGPRSSSPPEKPVRFCGRCGTRLKPAKKFCTDCGTPVSFSAD